jgi:hypothetical protein
MTSIISFYQRDLFWCETRGCILRAIIRFTPCVGLCLASSDEARTHGAYGNRTMWSSLRCYLLVWCVPSHTAVVTALETSKSASTNVVTEWSTALYSSSDSHQSYFLELNLRSEQSCILQCDVTTYRVCVCVYVCLYVCVYVYVFMYVMYVCMYVCMNVVCMYFFYKIFIVQNVPLQGSNTTC